MEQLSKNKLLRASRIASRSSLRIGIIDTGVNPWHSHVRGGVYGCRIFLDGAGRIQEDDDFRDLVGHGTAVSGILRKKFPELEIFAVRAFEQDLTSYPSLIARAILRATVEGCSILNLSLGMPPGPGSDVLVNACKTALDAGCILVAAGRPGYPGLLPASIPGVISVVADDRVPLGAISLDTSGNYNYSASGQPRDLNGLPTSENLWGNSFACARVSAHFVAQLIGSGKKALFLDLQS
jgi:subtilisin family serine protease